MTPHAFRLSPAGDPPGSNSRTPGFPESSAAEDEALQYRVEIWDETGAAVEQVVAISLSPAIGYAAFYAATREFPGRAITLRHRERTLSRWTARIH